MYSYLESSGQYLYDMINLISAVFLLVFNLTQIKRKRLLLSTVSVLCINHFKKNKNRLFSKTNFWVVVEIVVISLFQYGLAPSINTMFGRIVETGGNYFGLLFFMPVIILMLFYLIGVDPLKQTDLITPAYPLALVFVKLACFCAGCCSGIECSFGLYNPDSGLVEFPLQLLEAGLALLIFIFLLFWRKKAKEGTLFPTYVIIYCVTRFSSEFLSSKPDIVWKLNTYHILCIIGVIVGIIELIAVQKFGDKIKKIYGENNITTLYDKAKKGVIDYKIKRKRSKEKIYHKYK